MQPTAKYTKKAKEKNYLGSPTFHSLKNSNLYAHSATCLVKLVYISEILYVSMVKWECTIYT